LFINAQNICICGAKLRGIFCIVQARSEALQITLEHLQQLTNKSSPIEWYWWSPTILFKILGEMFQQITNNLPQYMGPTYQNRGCGRKKYDTCCGANTIQGDTTSPLFERRYDDKKKRER